MAPKKSRNFTKPLLSRKDETSVAPGTPLDNTVLLTRPISGPPTQAEHGRNDHAGVSSAVDGSGSLQQPNTLSIPIHMSAMVPARIAVKRVRSSNELNIPSSLPQSPSVPIDTPPLQSQPRNGQAGPSTSNFPNLLQRFLQERLPRLEMAEKRTRSTNTRGPKSFDMHLHPDLRLKRVEFVDDLTMELSNVCDDYVKKVEHTGRPSLESVPEFHVPYTGNFVNEASLQTYLIELNKRLSPIASGLLFQVDWLPVFDFSTSPAGCRWLKEATADGYLSITEDSSVLDQLSPEARSLVEVIKKYDLQNIVAEEYKNLVAGAMIFGPQGIESMAGDFFWEACMDRSIYPRESSSCGGDHRINGRLKVTGRQTGPDSPQTAQTFLKQSNTANEQTELADDSQATSAKRQRLEDENNAEMEESNVEMRARHVMQQLWAAAVVQDATFLVFSSGNEEYIGLRQRDTQTLFLSRLIKPSEQITPAYIKIRIGLYIASFLDAALRAIKLEEVKSFPNVSPPSRYHLQIDEEIHLWDASDSKTRRVQEASVETDEEIIQDLERSSFIALWRHKRNLNASMAEEEARWVLKRVSSSQMDRQIPTAPQSLRILPPTYPGGCSVNLDIDDPTKLGRVYRVYLDVARAPPGHPKHLSVPLILKMSRDDEEAQNLLREHQIYQLLNSRGFKGILKCYGLFSYTLNGIDTRLFLLLEHGGDSITQRRDKNGRKALNRHVKKRKDDYYQQALDALHDRNFLHMNITEAHVLMDMKRQKVSFISLKRAGFQTDPRIFEMGKREDSRKLKQCLGSKGERSIDVSRAIEEVPSGQDASHGSFVRAASSGGNQAFKSLIDAYIR